MRDFTILLKIWLLITTSLPAAVLTTGEWFIDQKPGEGSGTPITGVSGASFTRDLTIDAATIASLSDGPHLLGTRFRDDAGNWGHPSWRLFLVTHPGGDLSQGEYFFNEDPGEGAALPLSGVSGNAVTLTPTESLAALPAGANLIGIRFRNAAGDWGHASHRIFLNPEPAGRPLNQIDFVLFNGETEMTSGTFSGDGSLVIDLPRVPIPATLTTGEHLVLQLQAVDSSGLMGHPVSRQIAVEDFSESFLDLFFTSSEQADPSTSGDQADADKDGISNLVEQATGLHPREANSPGEATSLDTRSGNQRTFRFRSAAETIFDAPSSTFTLGSLRFEVEISDNAETWNKATAPEDFAIAPESAANDDGSYTHILNLTNGPENKQFHRLKIVRP